MILEFLHAFGDLFDLNDEFPDGVTIGKIYYWLLINTIHHEILFKFKWPNSILAYTFAFHLQCGFFF